MPINKARFRSAEEFETWAASQAAETGDDGIDWRDWFKDEMPQSYPVICVFFWFERAGLITRLDVEYIYPPDFERDWETPEPINTDSAPESGTTCLHWSRAWE